MKTVLNSLLYIVLFQVVWGIGACQKPETAPLTVATIFSDHMVLQGKKDVKIWGTATPEAEVTVKFRDQSVTAVADTSGHWLASLQPLAYGGPDSLVVATSKFRKSFTDVLVGEVWICSGQSNMEMPMQSDWAKLNNADAEIQAANFPEIRLFMVGHNTTVRPVDTLSTSGWAVCTPESVKFFSASAFFFGRNLYQSLKIPIGLVETAWGGTVAEAWTSKDGLAALPEFDGLTQKISQMPSNKDTLALLEQRDKEQQAREIAAAEKGLIGDSAIYAQANYPTQDWTPIDLPRLWEETSLGNFDGSCWFRKEVSLTANQITDSITFSYGGTDDADELWCNGQKIGQNDKWNVLRVYRIAPSVLHLGKNIFTIRVMDFQGGGGFMGEAKDYALTLAGGKQVPMAKGWLAKQGFDFKSVPTKPFSPTNPNQPTVLFNGMINPLIPFAFRGVIWYQGESNSGMAFQYRKLFKALITDWRTQWRQGDFPFLFVQLANYLKVKPEPAEDTWAELREAQFMALELPNTGMAVSVDIGDARDIHPGNKQEVGRRLSLAALAKVYEQKIPFSGPLYKSIELRGSEIAISFSNPEVGLVTKGD
ncbi:MAG: hypothetical protein RIS47_378, partial [Bacteroidota bacterium]